MVLIKLVFIKILVMIKMIWLLVKVNSILFIFIVRIMINSVFFWNILINFLNIDLIKILLKVRRVNILLEKFVV